MRVYGYSVFDTAVGAYLPLFFVRNNGEAIRSFTDAVNDPKHQFHAHATDYVLFCMCVFDDETGVVTQNEAGPVRLVNALDVVQRDVSPTSLPPR